MADQGVLVIIPRSGDSPINLSSIGLKIGPALEHMQWLIWLLLASFLVLGVVAVVNPNRFRAIASSGARWVDTSNLLQKLDKPVDIDHVVLRHSRAFGVAVVLSSLFLAYQFAVRILG